MIAAVVVLGVGRMVWRIWHDNEELVAGGSMSHQMFGRPRHGKPDEQEFE